MTSFELIELAGEKADLLREISHYKRFAKKETVFRQDDDYRGPYIVTEGQFKVFLTGESGKETILHIFKPGEILASAPLFLDGGYPASCAALVDGCLVAFEYERLVKLLASDGAINAYFLEKSVQLLPRLKDKIRSLALKNAEQRIVDYLKLLGAEHESVSLEIPKNQIAVLLDLTPESVSRIFAMLIAKGLLVVENNGYRLR